MEFWKSDRETFYESILEPRQYIANCLKDTLQDSCTLPAFFPPTLKLILTAMRVGLGRLGQPIDPEIIFGGFRGTAFLNSTALVVTILLDNSPSYQG